jgi:hypothetical protein
LGKVFLELGVGEGSVRGMEACDGAGGRPRGVEKGEACFAARGGFVLVGLGVEGPGVGVEPEMVRFFPGVAGLAASNGPSKVALRPRDIAADIKYPAF